MSCGIADNETGQKIYSPSLYHFITGPLMMNELHIVIKFNCDKRCNTERNFFSSSHSSIQNRLHCSSRFPPLAYTTRSPLTVSIIHLSIGVLNPTRVLHQSQCITHFLELLPEPQRNWVTRGFAQESLFKLQGELPVYHWSPAYTLTDQYRIVNRTEKGLLHYVI